MGKKKFYLVLDTETATLPLVKEIADKCGGKLKKTLPIAKPIIYDIGWQIIDRLGNVYKSTNYLVQETFFVPQVFNTAYYKDKRPIYMDMLAKGEITAKLWNDIVPELIADAEGCEAVCAYNAAFDFKKAISYTEQYITALYSDINDFERKQRYSCEMCAKEGKVNTANPEYLTPEWEIREKTFPVIDLWDVVCNPKYKLINIDKFRKFCLDNGYWTDSVLYFRTSAETAYRYLENDWGFEESHTALDDAKIEAQMLVKALKKGKIDPCMGAFPFRNLGDTPTFAKEKYRKSIPSLINALQDYINTQCGKSNSYTARMENVLAGLESELDGA